MGSAVGIDVEEDAALGRRERVRCSARYGLYERVGTLTCAALRVRGCDVHAHACLLAPASHHYPPPPSTTHRRATVSTPSSVAPRWVYQPRRERGNAPSSESSDNASVVQAVSRCGARQAVDVPRKFSAPGRGHGRPAVRGTCEAPSSSASSPCSIYSIPESSGAGGRCWAGDWEKGGLMMMTGEHTSVLLYVRRLTLPMLGARQAQCTSGRFLGCARGCALHPVRAVCVSRVARFRASRSRFPSTQVSGVSLFTWTGQASY